MIHAGIGCGKYKHHASSFLFFLYTNIYIFPDRNDLVNYLVIDEAGSDLRIVGRIQKRRGGSSRHHTIAHSISEPCFLGGVRHVEIRWVVQLAVQIHTALLFGLRDAPLHAPPAPPDGLLGGYEVPHELPFHKGIVGAVHVHVEMEAKEVVVENPDRVFRDEVSIHLVPLLRRHVSVHICHVRRRYLQSSCCLHLYIIKIIASFLLAWMLHYFFKYLAYVKLLLTKRHIHCHHDKSYSKVASEETCGVH